MMEVTDNYKILMLKRILQTLLLCLATIVLTTKVAMSRPLPGSMVIIEHIPVYLAVNAADATPPKPPQAGKPSPAPNDSQKKDPPVTQADPSNPQDPYDYDAIRESNRQTYGEMKGKEPK
jgi:hypothetical protein